MNFRIAVPSLFLLCGACGPGSSELGGTEPEPQDATEGAATQDRRLDAGTVDAGVPRRNDTVGLVSQAQLAQLYATNAQVAPSEFQFGKEHAAFQLTTALAGDFDHDGKDSLGLFDPRTAEFQLKNGNAFGGPDLVFTFGPTKTKGLVGDFDGDGITTIGTYAGNGTFRLRNSNSSGPPDLVFVFGPGATAIPFAGDFDGDGVDTVGVYVPSTGVFMLRNSNGNGGADLEFTFGAPGLSPVVGDFDGDGVDTVGVWDQERETFYLRNTNSAGAPDITIALPHVEWDRMPVAGKWAKSPTPVPLGYEWPTATPQAQRIDPVKLDAAFVNMGKLPPMLSLLVFRRGKLVREQYWNGATRSLMTNVKSVSKSIDSALTQVAIQQGKISRTETLDQLFPEYVDANDPQRTLITLKDIMNMRAGFDWDDQRDLGPMIASNDWVKFVIDKPVIHPSGAYFEYSTGLTHLVATALQKRVPKPLDAWATEVLFAPLGIQSFRWDKEPFRAFVGGCEMFFTPRDLARVGELYRLNGTLDGVPLLDPDAVLAATSGPSNYTSFWWWSTIRGHPTFAAHGHGGQRIWVMRDLQLVVVATSKANVSYADSAVHVAAMTNVFTNDLVPAVMP